MHVVGIAAQEVVHQSAQRIVPVILTVDVQDVFPIIEKLVVDKVDSLDGTDTCAAIEEVVLGNEDRIGLGQFLERLTRIQRLDVHRSAVVAGTLRPSAVVSALYFDVVLFVFTVHAMYVQAQGSRTEQSLQVLLGLLSGKHQIGLASDDAQHKLRQRQVVPKQATHEGIVNGTKTPKALQVFLMVTLLKVDVIDCHGHHLHAFSADIIPRLLRFGK